MHVKTLILGIIDSSKAPNDPVITNKGLTFTDTKYVQINVPWIQNSNAWTEVNFWLFYISGDIGSFVGVALQVIFLYIFKSH